MTTWTKPVSLVRDHAVIMHHKVSRYWTQRTFANFFYISLPETLYKDGWRVSTSTRCTKTKPKYPKYSCCHLVVVTSSGARVCAGGSGSGVAERFKQTIAGYWKLVSWNYSPLDFPAVRTIPEKKHADASAITLHTDPHVNHSCQSWHRTPFL